MLAALPLALVTAGCGTAGSSTPDQVAGSSTADGVTGTITVSAASSLTAPFEAIGRDFEQAHPGTHVVFNFDSSGTLVTQIRAGAPADVIASADEASMASLADGGLLRGAPTRFAGNRLTIVVKAGNPRGVRALADLATVGTVALCGPDAPCGRYADQILRTAGVTVPPERVTRVPNAKATLAAVAEGDADAGIVYVTDVTGDRVEAVPLPEGQNATAAYPIAVVASSAQPATASAFVADVTGPRGQGRLRAAGFLTAA